jgi:precorrin-2 dehydrogenase / sirohydrochlorin ferrochelatase
LKALMKTSYYPIFLDLIGKLCIVVGGGKVAERKIRGLLDAGAKVRVISPVVSKGISMFVDTLRVELVNREYRSGDLKSGVLAFAATDSEKVNREIREEASSLSVFVNVADNPHLCDFVVPSTVRKDPVLVALSTSGLLPGLSKRLRQEVLERIGGDYPAYVRRVGAFRRFLIETIADGRVRKRIMKEVASAEMSAIAHMTAEEMKQCFLEPDHQQRPLDNVETRDCKRTPRRRSGPKGSVPGQRQTSETGRKGTKT